MKLKKIASLALAGVMAVSMLAGCANKPGSSEPTTEPTTDLSAAVAAAVVEQLGDKAEEKNITVTADAGLKATLDQVVGSLDVLGVNLNNIKTYMPKVDTALTVDALPAISGTVYANDSKVQSSFDAYVLSASNDGNYNENYYVTTLAAQILKDKVHADQHDLTSTSLPTESNPYTNADGTRVKFEFSYEVKVAVTAVESSLDNSVKYVVAWNVVRTPTAVDA